MRAIRPLILLAALLAAVPFAIGQDEPAPDPVRPARVLVTGPVALPLPAFHDAEQRGVDLDALFADQPAVPGGGWPAAGRGFTAPGGAAMAWSEADEAAFTAPAAGAAVAWTALTLRSDRWQEATLTVIGSRPVKGVLGDAALDLAAGEGDTLTATLKLPMGEHRLVLRTLFDPEAEIEGPWNLDLEITPGEGAVTVTTSPERTTDIGLILDAPRVSDLALSPDGRFAAVSIGEYRNGSDHETWLEIRDTKNGALIALWRGGGTPAGLRWLDQGNHLSWSTRAGDNTTIWLYDLDRGVYEPVLQDVAKLGSWRWAPDGGSIVYEVRHEPEADKRKVKRVKNPADRQPWYRNSTHLEQAFVPGGFTRRLTAGAVSPGSWRFAPDGRSLVFFLGEQDLAARPFFRSELWRLDLETLAAELLLDDPWIGGAEFSPDGRTLLLSGSPSAFAGLGRNLPEGVQANDYGGQLFLWPLDTREAAPLTREFTPDVVGVSWCPADGMIYARCTDTQFSNVYRLKPGDDDGWQKVATGFGYTSEIALPRDGRTAVARGSDNTLTIRVHAVDLKKNEARLLLDPGAEAWQDVTFGEVKPWTASLPNGEQLDGRIYFPPHFDPQLTYPVIVYYYGGTSPVTVDFGGRYPKNAWAAQGYIVYVPEPSGATGYGQEMAARHVNDWGKITAMEVIEGTKAFLEAHPYADTGAVGCIGASYGGFLTQYVITQTDIFAAAVSHAGISSISSYWGEGLWGYAYGTRALADAYPWRDRDIYVEQSALFHADKITTPLLLVHGDSDTNVPVGESDQMFTALKLLGREVEYVQIQGQDHWVVDHDQRIVWHDTILAFFAKHLKGREAWWNALYPEPEDWR